MNGIVVGWITDFPTSRLPKSGKYYLRAYTNWESKLMAQITISLNP